MGDSENEEPSEQESTDEAASPVADLEGALAAAQDEIAELTRSVSGFREQEEEREHARAERHSRRAQIRRRLAQLFVLVNCIGAIVAGSWTYQFYRESEAQRFRPEAPPVMGERTLSATQQSVEVRSETEGVYPARVLNENCHGFVPRSAHLRIQNGSPRETQIWTSSRADLVLFMRDDSSGEILCDADGGHGGDAFIRTRMERGSFTIWVGTKNAYARAPFSLRVESRHPTGTPDNSGLGTEADPTIDRVPITGDTFLRRFEGSTRGFVAASDVHEGCTGFVPVDPTFSLDVGEPRTVNVAVDSPADLVMLWRTDTGDIHCDDNSGVGLNPRLQRTLDHGEHRIWIGVSNSLRTESFHAEISAWPSNRQHRTLHWTGEPQLGERELNRGEVVIHHAASGVVPATLIGRECYGFLPVEPTVTVNLLRNRTVRLAFDDGNGLELVVQHPDGSHYCAAGEPPTQGEWTQGRHQIWVGVADITTPLPYSLAIEAR